MHGNIVQTRNIQTRGVLICAKQIKLSWENSDMCTTSLCACQRDAECMQIRDYKRLKKKRKIHTLHGMTGYAQNNQIKNGARKWTEKHFLLIRQNNDADP